MSSESHGSVTLKMSHDGQNKALVLVLKEDMKGAYDLMHEKK